MPAWGRWLAGWLRLGPGIVAPHLQHAPSGLLGHVANPISSQKNPSVRRLTSCRSGSFVLPCRGLFGLSGTMPNGPADRPRLSLSLSRKSSPRSEASSSPTRVDPDLLPYHQRSSGNLLADIAHTASPTVTSAASGMEPALSKASSASMVSTHLSSSDNEHFSIDMLSPNERAASLKGNSERLSFESGTESSKTGAPRPRRTSLGLLSRLLPRFRARDPDASRSDSARSVRRMAWATAGAASKPPPKTCVQAAAETLLISSRPDSPIKSDDPAVGKQPNPKLTKEEALQVLSDSVKHLRERNILKRDARMWIQAGDLPTDAALSEPPQPLGEGSQVAPRPGGWGGAGGAGSGGYLIFMWVMCCTPLTSR